MKCFEEKESIVHWNSRFLVFAIRFVLDVVSFAVEFKDYSLVPTGNVSLWLD